MEVSVITYKSNYTSSRQLHLITGGVPCQVIKSIRMQPTHSENFITITRAALKQDVAKNEFSNVDAFEREFTMLYSFSSLRSGNSIAFAFTGQN